MGNFLLKAPDSPYDQSLIHQLKLRTLKDISECITVITEDYPDTQCLDYSQFEDIFCPILDDQEPFFLKLQNDHDLDGTVDIYESLAAFVIFSGDKFESKAHFIFQLFDFDHSNTLEIPEMVLTLQAAARALCKFVNINPPSLKVLEEMSETIFLAMDRDNNKKVSYDEFLYWIKANDDLQNFLLKYANMQTYEHMKKRFQSIYTVTKHLFTMACGSPLVDVVEEAAIANVIRKDGAQYIKEKVLDFVLKVLRDSTHAYSHGKAEFDLGKFISRKAYDNVMKTWSAFSAADVNNDNSIVHHELHTLLWVFEAQEPSDDRVKNEMKEIDKDQSGYIDRYEWVNNFCSTDKNGKNVFRSNLRELFEKYDADNSGYLSISELKDLVMEACKGHLKRAKDAESRALLNNMIETLTLDILKDLDQSGSNTIQWPEFQRYMEIAMQKYKQLNDFLDMHM